MNIPFCNICRILFFIVLLSCTDENQPEPPEYFLVSHSLCFSTYEKVPINNNMMTFNTRSATNINHLSSALSTPVSLGTFLENGFNSGDIVYGVQYAVIYKFSFGFYLQTQNHDIIETKLTNPSNIAKFTLQ